MAVVVVDTPRQELPRLQTIRLLSRTWGTTAAMRLRATLMYSPRRMCNKASLFVMKFWSLVLFLVLDLVVVRGNGG